MRNQQRALEQTCRSEFHNCTITIKYQNEKHTFAWHFKNVNSCKRSVSVDPITIINRTAEQINVAIYDWSTNRSDLSRTYYFPTMIYPLAVSIFILKYILGRSRPFMPDRLLFFAERYLSRLRLNCSRFFSPDLLGQFFVVDWKLLRKYAIVIIDGSNRFSLYYSRLKNKNGLLINYWTRYKSAPFIIEGRWIKSHSERSENIDICISRINIQI